MCSAVRKFSLGLLITSVLSVSAALAQDLGDLGSSSGIFRSPNPKTANKNKSAPKTTAPKEKPVSKPTAVKSEPRKAASNRPQASSSRKRPAAIVESRNEKSARVKTREQPADIREDIIITVGSKNRNNLNLPFERALDEGNTARDNRDYAAAERAYRRAQALKPKDSRAIYGLGNVFSDQQLWEGAEKAYRQAITLEPDIPESYIALSYVLTQPIIGISLSERYAEAEKLARRAVELDPSSAVAYDQLGVALEMRGVIGSETQEAYRTAIKLDPGFALAYAHLGRVLRRNGLNEESQKAYADAIRLASDVPTMIHVAEVMQSQLRYAESEQLLRRALREDPKNPTALFLLGRALTTSGKFEEAETLLKKCIEVTPKSFIAHTQLGSLYTRRGNYADAEKILFKAISFVSANEKKRLAQEFETIGDAYMRLGRRTDAERVYRQALALDGEKTNLADKLSQARKS